MNGILLKITNPSTSHGSVQSSFNISNNNSTTGNTFIEKDVLLFELTNDRREAETCQVDLIDDSGNGPLGSASVSWSDGDGGTQFIEFSNFPVDASGELLDSCDYEIWLVNDKSDSGVVASVNIYRG